MTEFAMTREEAADLARFIERLRRRLPGDTWHKPGIEDALGRARDRADAPDLAMAAIRAACEPTNRTPAVIGMDGPHWREASRPPRPEQVDSHDRCSVCSLHRNACRLRWAHDHDFEPSSEAANRKGDPATSARVGDLRENLAPTSGPTERKGLEDMAAANPELHARVQALRDANPGLVAPPLRADDQPTDQPTQTAPAVESEAMA